MSKERIIKDLLYFDLPKSVSLFSQLDQGIVTQTTAVDEESLGIDSSAGVDFKIFQAKLGANNIGKETQSVTRIPHHDLLNKLQLIIDDSESYIDLDEIEVSNIEELHVQIKHKSFVKATGWVNIEDYERLKKIASRFNAIVRFIQECSISGNPSFQQYEQVKKELEKHKKLVNQQKDRNAKAKDLTKLNKLENDLDQILDQSLSSEKVPDYLIEGTQLIIDTFLPSRINFRFYPFETLREFEILSNLKREHFVETDIENIIFSYGSRPNLKMTIFGLITSVPEEHNQLFDPLNDNSEKSADEAVVFERAFRGLFRGFEGFEQFVRYSKFPKVTVNPLAIYREIKL